MKACYAILILCFISCNTDEKFDRNKWINADPVDRTYRKNMVNDLLNKYKFRGMPYKELINLLGNPDNIGTEKYTDSVPVYYTVDEKYDMIDPVAGQDLIFHLNKDSVVTSVTVQKWKR
jgi:hypothetical protein